MWYAPTIVTPIASEPVSLADAKSQCRVDGADEDALVSRLITAARTHVEKYCAVLIGAQTVDSKCNSFDDMAKLDVAPVASVTSIKYVDTSGVEQTLATSVYELRADGIEASIVLKYGQQWPATQPGSRITLRAVAGHATPPADMVHAMILLIAEWYANRENTVIGASVAPMPAGVDALLCNHRRFA